jgi:hypothetical protein
MSKAAVSLADDFAKKIGLAGEMVVERLTGDARP